MIKVIRRETEPGVPLPFLPRSVGTNKYAQAGPQEDIAGIDAVEICTVASGECEIEQRGGMVTLTAGESLYKLPGEHRKKTVLSGSGAEIYWATFEGPHAADFMLSFGYPAGALPTGECPVELYEEIARNLILGTDGALRRTVALYTELIVRLLGRDAETEGGSRILPECLRLIRTHFADPDFNVDSLAAAAGLHRTTLLRLFRRELNTTPLEYLTQCRIRHALDLLRTTLIPVSEVAASSGFRQCNYFCKVIRDHCGKTPQDYRRQI